MPGKILLFLVCCWFSVSCVAQEPAKNNAIDTSFTDYESLFSELDLLLDSLMTPRNFVLLNVGMTSGYYYYESKEDNSVRSLRKWVYTPTLAFFSKSGLGISGGASIINDGGKFNPYQFSLTGSFDYIKNKKLITGISFTHFFTKNNLAFYTSPLQSGAYAYFTYRGFWLKPSLAASYGWGTRSEYTKREERIKTIRLKRRGYTTVNTQETINDFNLTASIRHDFYWLNTLFGNDYVRLTPQISFISGTQKFGIYQSNNTFATLKGTGQNVLYNSENSYLDDKMVFQPLSLTGYLKTEYSIGKFFIQPQVMFDYYLPATGGAFTTAFLVNAGVIF